MSQAFLKKLGIASGVLILLWIVNLYRQVPHSQRPFAKADAQAERVVLQQGPKKVELLKQGNVWKVASGSGSFYAAEENLVKTLLSGLKDVEVEDEISSRADRAAEYEVNLESGTHVSLLGAKEVKGGEGIFGKQAPDFAHIYFRYPDKPNVYLARGIIRGELGNVEVNSWRSRQLIDVPETKIQGITLEGKGFKTELVRTSTDVWTLNGKIIETGPVNALVGTLAHLRFNEFVDPVVYPTLTYEGLTLGRIIIKGGESPIELRIGAEDMKSKRIPVAISKEAGLGWLPESLIQSLQQRPSAFPEKK